MTLLTDIKMKIKHTVETSYKFYTSRTPETICYNAKHVKALLTKMTFVYKVRLVASLFAAN
jgi:hypothetical protein